MTFDLGWNSFIVWLAPVLDAVKAKWRQWHIDEYNSVPTRDNLERIHLEPISPWLRNSSSSRNIVIVYSMFWTRTKWIPQPSQEYNDLIFVCRKCFCCSNCLVIVFWLIDNDIDHIASKDHTKIKTLQEWHWSKQTNNDKLVVLLFLSLSKKCHMTLSFPFCSYFDWEALVRPRSKKSRWSRHFGKYWYQLSLKIVTIIMMLSQD